MARGSGDRVFVWPWWQRALHWALAVCVLTALVTHEGGRLHESLGYAALALALTRIVLGVAGPAAARFGAFTRGPRATLAYARRVWRRDEPRHLNHNPLGAWMVLVLLALSALGAAVGWLYTTDRFWGEGWVIGLHALLTWPLIAAALLHVAGVVHAGRRHRENLVGAMLHGYKPAGPDAVDGEGLLPQTGPRQ